MVRPLTKVGMLKKEQSWWQVPSAPRGVQVLWDDVRPVMECEVWSRGEGELGWTETGNLSGFPCASP